MDEGRDVDAFRVGVRATDVKASVPVVAWAVGEKGLLGSAGRASV